MTGLYRVGGFSSDPTDTVELKSTPCWLCGEVKTFTARVPVTIPVGFFTSRDVQCQTCAVGWRVVIRSDKNGQLLVLEEGET